MVRDKIRRTIEDHKLIEKNQHIVLGLSGGPDSVCLFYVLLELAQEMNLTIHPVHINHKFRPGAAEEDQHFVEELCRTNGLTCRTFIYDCNAIAKEQKITSEEAGRNARYEAFAKVAAEVAGTRQSGNNIRIAVAQNADDQAETVMFRILRGVGTDGLAGISYKRFDEYGNMIIRPLLDVTKAEVNEFCAAEGITPQIDKTNLQPLYTRNRIRLRLLPYIEKEYNPNIKETLRRTAKIAAADSDCLLRLARELYEKAQVNPAPDRQSGNLAISLDVGAVRNAHKAIRLRVFSLALAQLGLTEDVAMSHLEACDDIVFSGKPSARCDLPGGYQAARQYGLIRFNQPAEPGRDSQPGAEAHPACVHMKSLPRAEIRIIPREEFRGGEYLSEAAGPTDAAGGKPTAFAAFDFDLIKKARGENAGEHITLRNRQPGDYITLAENHRKKLQDFFVDRKIPKNLRDSIAVAACGSEVLFIAPFGEYLPKGRFSAMYKLCDATKNVLLIEIIG